jgi:2'-5' RNA ligase
LRDPKDTRLFFALWPDDDTRRRLQRAAQCFEVARPARRVPDHNLHLTLHFVGNVYYDEMACMREAAGRVQGRRFELDIDRSGSFDKARVAWLGCVDIPGELTELHRELGAELAACGFRAELRPYNPHVTIARKMAGIDSATAFEPVRWRVEQFALIEVHAVQIGVEYRVVESWDLS